jgi:hypothetical protein
MKEMIMLLCGILIGRHLMAQTFSEWFRQNHTQLKYLGEQIAALRGYDGVLRQGYAIAGERLLDIDTITDADLEEHRAHFASLEEVNPAVQETEMVEWIRGGCMLVRNMAGDLGSIIPTGMTEAAEAGEKELADVLADHRLQMDDAERLERLLALSQRVRELIEDALALLRWLEVSPQYEGL